MPGHRQGGDALQVQALADDRTNRGHLGEQDARGGDGGADQLLGRWQRLFGGQGPYPLQRFEADRAHHDKLAGHRLEKQRGLTDDLTEFGFDARRADQLFQVLQPGAALAAERDRIGLSGIQTIDKGVCRSQWLVLSVGGYPALFVDRHVVLSPSVCISRVSLVVLWAVASEAVWPALPCGGHAIRRRVATGSGASCVRANRQSS